MRIAMLQAVGLVMLFTSLSASADTWIPYTDGRAGGCWLNNANVLYGCTPQTAQNSSENRAFHSQSREDYCWKERQRLQNANSSTNRTVTSMRAAEERFARSGCE